VAPTRRNISLCCANLRREDRRNHVSCRCGPNQRITDTAARTSSMGCPHCATEQLSHEARFCARCGAALPRRAAGLLKAASLGRAILLPLALVRRALAWPIRKRQERIRWLTDASGPNSPINDANGLSDEAKRVYACLASVTLRCGSSHSRVRTVAKAAGAGAGEHRGGAPSTTGPLKAQQVTGFLPVSK
jgi:hypothetical protein